MAADSRTNAGYDQVNSTRKLHAFVQRGQRVFVIMTSGSLSCTQSVLTLLRRDFDKGKGLAACASLYDAARIAGEQVRKIAQLDRAALERDEYRFNVHILLGGQVRGEPPGLYLIYPQGNPLQATFDTPYLQIGETKYGRPILDRGIQYEHTSLEEAAKYALLSMDSTMKSNVTVGPPIDLVAYSNDELDITRQRKFEGNDPAWVKLRSRWDVAMRQAIARLPAIRFVPHTNPTSPQQPETIQVVEPMPSEAPAEPQPQPVQRAASGARRRRKSPLDRDPPPVEG